MILPDFVTDQDDWLCVEIILIGSEITTQNRHYTQQGKRGCGNVRAQIPLWFIRPGHDEGRAVRNEDSIQCADLFLEIEIVRKRDSDILSFGEGLRDVQDAVLIFH